MKSIKVFYYKKNFGDEMNEYISQNIFHIKVKQVIRASRCEALFIGSNIEKFLFYDEPRYSPRRLMKTLEPVNFWGPGFIQEASAGKIELKRRINVFALRGLLSRARLENIVKRDLGGIVLGDPGLLASELLSTNHGSKIYRLGVIPHYVDKTALGLKKINIPKTIIIDVQQNPIEVVKNIAKCEFVISSSLHGLIVSDSLGIPNARLILSDKIVGGDYKFNDYYSVYGMKTHKVYDLRCSDIGKKDIDDIAASYYITRKQTDSLKQALIRAFPY